MAFFLDLPSITPEYVATLPCVTYNNSDKLPSCAGVYAIYAYGSKSNNPKILYIGKSENFHTRIKHHSLVPQLKLLQYVDITVYIAYLELDIPFDDVGIIETIFINKLSPHFNVHHKKLANILRHQTLRNKREIQSRLQNTNVCCDESHEHNKTIRELKKEASQLGVSHYSYMTKTQLLTAIAQIKTEPGVM